MDSTSPTQARTACRTSDFFVAFGSFVLALVERRFPPKPGFAAEDERTRHCVDAAVRLHGTDESTAAARDAPV